jgi:hypothetical protein
VIAELVNSIPGVESLSYLELGTGDGDNFRAVKCTDKCTVDNKPLTGTFFGTTDDFFAQNTRRYDITFIDADHNVDSVVKDFNSAIKITNKWVFLHDLYPPEEFFANYAWSGDAFRFLNHVYTNKLFPIYVLNNDFGLSAVRMPVAEPVADIQKISYDEFIINSIPTITFDQFKEILNT